MPNRRLNILLPGALFSGLGIFAWLLLANYTESGMRIEATLRSPWAASFLIVLFNALGFLVIRLSAWLNMQYVLNVRRKRRIVVVYLAVMLLFLSVNYGFLVAGKLLAGSARPFIFPNGGVRILVVVWLVELVVLGLLLANRAMAQTLLLQQRAAALQRENNAARYAALQSQLNPHFLFNSLNTLVAEIEYDPQQAAAFTRRLSDVYRYVLQAQARMLVTLGEELTFAEAYLYLHAVRLGDCIRCRTDISDEDRDLRLPPLTLQLLIENVVKHNGISPLYPMQIMMNVADGWLEVSNTFRPKSCAVSTGTGLANLSSRCRIITGRDIRIVRSPDLFTVKIPLLYE